MNRLKERFVISSRIRREAEQRRLSRAANLLAPAGQPQESLIAMLHFLLRHSIGLVSFLYENLNLSAFEHQVLSVD